jgi:hypothetical protein
MSKKMVTWMLAAAMAAASGTALAHGDEKAEHGGTLAVAQDLAVELVPQSDGAALYLQDHGKPMSTQGMSGKLTVLNGTERSQGALAAAGGNKLEAKGIRIASGAKAVAALTLANAKTLTVRFTVK